MHNVSRSAVGVAGFVLIASAVLGLYLGYSRASAAPGAGAGETTFGVTTASVAAKNASPIPDSAPTPPVPDETFIRKIAREEVQSALHPKRPAPASSDSDDDSDSSDDAGADHPANPAPPAQIAPQPLTVPPAPQ